MSETPHGNSNGWRWKWKKRKQMKARNRHSNGQLLDNGRGSTCHDEMESRESRRYSQGSDRRHRQPSDNRNQASTRTREATSAPAGNQEAGGTSQSTAPHSGHFRHPGSRESLKALRTTCTCTSHQATSDNLTQNAGSSSRTSASVSSEQPSEKNIREIPGFYYDPEKKRYFRLVAGHNNFNPLTRERLEKQDAEKKREKMLDDNLPTCRKQGTQLQNVSLQRHRQTGRLTPRQFARCSHEQVISNLSLRPSKLDNFPDQYFDGESGDISFLQVDPNQQKVLMVLSHDYLSRMWQGTITCDSTKPKALTVSKWKVINIIGTRNTKVTSASWISSASNLYVIYSLCGPTNSVQLLKCSSDEADHNHITYSYESNNESAWTCAWSSNPLTQEYLSIGSNNKAIVVDTKHAGKWKVFSNHSDVLAQVFATRNPVLYNGTRRGEILGCDLRSLTETRSDINLRLRQKVAVCSIRLLRDENYLIASDMSGQIRLWDLRQCLCVQEFKGHHNRHANLPICLDSTESVLYGVGQDCYTRFWSLPDGHLLRTIPCPQPPSTFQPRAVYSREWHNGAPPGLLLGIQRSLYWYPV